MWCLFKYLKLKRITCSKRNTIQMTKIHQPILGETQYEQQAAHSKISLPCFIKHQTIVTCLILNEKGKELGEYKITHKENKAFISFNISKLKPGIYNCWITVGKKVHIRQLTVKGTKTQSLIKRLSRQLFIFND